MATWKLQRLTAPKLLKLSRKPCIPDKKLLWNAIRKSWSLFQNPSHPVGNNNNKVTMKHQYNIGFNLSRSLLRICLTRAPPGDELAVTSFRAYKKTSLYPKFYKIAVKLQYNTNTKPWSGYAFRISRSAPGDEITMPSFEVNIKCSLCRKGAQ